MDLVWWGVEVDGLEWFWIDQGSSIQIYLVIDLVCGCYSYEIECECDWIFCILYFELVGDEFVVDFEFDGYGSWIYNGFLCDDFVECVDIDLLVLLFMNLLLLCWYLFDIGDEEDFVMVFVEFIDLMVFFDVQWYQCFDEDFYCFESFDSDFICDLMVDFDGFVVEYLGLFEWL